MQPDSSSLSNLSNKYKAFCLNGYRYEADSGTIFLSYEFEGGAAFEEQIVLGARDKPLAPDEQAAFDNALRLLHIAAGISYYKAYVPQRIEGASLSADEAAFFENFYHQGLGEFAHRNGIDLSGYHLFSESAKPKAAKDISLPRKSAVLIGGGKDSLVSVEALRAAGEEMVLFAVNPAKPILDCLIESGLPFVTVKRLIDPQLFELNKQDALNGHVPITGIISFIAGAAAIWHGFDTIILSNERSADELTRDGVNHQYSKSSGFEVAFQNLLHQSVTKSLSYFSLLRPLSEIGIARGFKKSDRYDGVFTSCNKAYSMTNPAKERWCGACPKCLFVFLVLATSLPKGRLEAVFGENLLDNEALVEGYQELTGLSGHKPWECVGEILESAAALYHLSQQDEWKDSAVVKALHDDLIAQYGSDKLHSEFSRALEFSSAPNLPADYLEVLKNYAG